MGWHPEALPPRARELARSLKRLEWLSRFYLAGGTALALQLGHRISVDLDFFSPEEFDSRQREEFKAQLSRLPGFKVREEQEGTLHVLLDGVETSFLHYRYPLLRKTAHWQGLRIASMADIGLMKIGAIIGRGARKDFIDLREICRTIPLASLLKLSFKKFPDAEDFLFQASKALVYFEDAQLSPSPKILRKGAWDEVKAYFVREAPQAWRAATLPVS